MAISTTVDVIASAIFTPRDLRDPLGVWGARLGVTGDASGGSIKVAIQVPAARRAEFVFTCYSVNIVTLSGSAENAQGLKIRLLTNWPNIDPLAGVQGYSTARFGAVNTDADFTSPIGGMAQGGPTGVDFLSVNDRFLLLYDPRPQNVAMAIVELEIAANTLATTYSFEGYGYYWDRAVMNTPGGLRHPGSD